ncbi:hypothetical protein JCM8097_007666 [Rhodosporidiobolus ruineniae]
MGVHGLTSYIRKNTSIHSHIALPDPTATSPAPFVVDGLAFLYQVGLVDTFRGGNYAAVRALVRRYILFWRACGLEPVFVWDGPFDTNKLPTVIQRSQQSLQRSLSYMSASDLQRATPALRNQASRLPPMTHMAVSAELEACGVACYCAEEEADSPTAELAQRLNGYVVSNDSDYFIYPARCRGYVPLSSIEYGPYNQPRLELVPLDTPPSLRLTVFQQPEVARALALPPSHLPVFAALVGNDLADYALDICLPRSSGPARFPGSMSPKEVKRIAGAVASCAKMPLSTQAEIQDVVFAVLPRLLQRPSQDPMIVVNLAKSAFGYALRPLEHPSPSYPLRPSSADPPTAAQSRALYETAYKSSHLSSFFLHILKHGTVLLQGSVEDPQYQSPLVWSCRPLRLWAYAVLQDALGGALPNGARVVEYVRRGLELHGAEVDVPTLANCLASTGVDPASYLSSSPSLPVLLSPQPVRLSLFLLALHFPAAPPPPSSPLHFYLPLVLSLRHIQRHAKRPLTSHELLSALLSAVLLRLAPASLPGLTAPLPFVPPKPLIHLSATLVQTLVTVNLLAQVLLLSTGQVDAQGTEGTLSAPFELFDGAALHALIQLGEAGVRRVLGGVPVEVGETVRALEQLVYLQ